MTEATLIGLLIAPEQSTCMVPSKYLVLLGTHSPTFPYHQVPCQLASTSLVDSARAISSFLGDRI